MAKETSYLRYLTNKNLKELTANRPASTNRKSGGFANPLGNLRGIEVPTTTPVETPSNDDGNQSAVGRVLDVLSRPAYAVGNLIKDSAVGTAISKLTEDEEEKKNHVPNAFERWNSQLQDNLKNKDYLGAVGDLARMTWNTQGAPAVQGITGKSKVMPSDAVLGNWDIADDDRNRLFAKGGKFAAGLALDIGLDPTTYIGAGAVRAVASKVPGVTKAGDALKAAGNVAKDTAKPAEIVQDVAKVVDETPEPIPQLNAPNATALDSTQALRKAANAKRTEDGRRVYDFSRIPSLFAKPKAGSTKSATESVVSPSDWASANKDMPITRNGDGKIVFSTVEDSDAATLGDVLRAAQRANNSRDLALVKELYETSVPGAAQRTPSASQVARAAAQAATGGRLARVQGARRAEVLAKYRDILDPEDVDYLTKSRGADDFHTRRREILSRVHSPVESSGILDSPTDSFLRQTLGEPAPVATRSAERLNPSSDDVIAELENTVRKQFSPEGVTGRTPDGFAQTAAGAIADRGFNTRAQYNLYSGLMRRSSSRLKQTGITGSQRAATLSREVLSNIDEAEAVLRSRGIEPILGNGQSGMALSFGDILHSLEKSTKGRAVLMNNVFDRLKGNVAVTNLADAYETLFTAFRAAGITNADEAVEFIRNIRASKEEGGLLQEIGWQLLKDPGGKGAAAKRGSVVKGLTRLEQPETVFKTINGKATRVSQRTMQTNNLGGKEAQGLTRQLIDAVTDPQVIKEVVRRSNQNAAEYGARLAADVPKISDPVITEFFDTWLKPTTSTGEAIRAYNRIDEAVDAAAKAGETVPAAKGIAQDVVDLAVADELAQDIPNMQSINRIVSAAKKGDVKTVVRTAQQMHNANAAEAAEAAFSRVVDIGENIEASLDNNVLRAMFPFLSKTPESLTGKLASTADKIATKFMPAAGHATLRPAATSMRSVARIMGNYWRRELSAVNDAFRGRPEELAEVFARIQNGTAKVAPGSPEEQLQNLVKVLFETGEDGTPGAMGAFFRNGFDLEHLNGKLAQMDTGVEFNLDAAQSAAKAKGTQVIDELADQWKGWKIDDPIDFMARIQASMQALSGDAAIAREAYRIAASKNLASQVQRKGFKQVTDLSGKSIMARYLPQGAWYHPDIIDEITAMDRVLRESQSFTTPFGQFVNRYLDPALGMFKSGMTIYRPGHHVRNLIGDEGLSFMADGVQSIKHKHNAIKVMATRNAYTDWDAMRALQGLPVSERISAQSAARGADTVSRFRLKGARQDTKLSAAEIQEAMRSRGTLPDFVTGEDLLESPNVSPTVKSVQDAMGKIFKGRVREAAGKVSEARDDFVRISHFLHILEKNSGKFKTLDEALEFAAARVRKWHPDGTDLSNFESKYMRRVFPFYSWTRKAIPLVAENMLMNPGRALVFPKAMYNAAKANGIDITSMSDPFPEDQLFPSFITDAQTGPVADIDGNYYTVNPGLPSTDIMNDFVGDPKAAVTGMLTPFIKAPIELATGTNLATGSKIQDKGQYIERTIPGLSHFNQLTGGSAAGSISRGQLGPEDPEKGFDSRLAILNFLSGLGIQNVSKPSYQTIAEIEARDRAAREANGG